MSVLGGWDLDFARLDKPTDSPFQTVNSFDRTNYAISVAAGRRYRSWLRSEFEFAIRRNGESADISRDAGDLNFDFDLTVLSLMKNAIIELNNKTRLTPYGGAGIGISYVDIQNGIAFSDGLDVSEFSSDADDTVFSWQAIAGVSARITERANFVTEYRYFSTVDVDFGIGGNSLDRFWANNLFFGLRLEF